jgi:hypothetical protein
MSYVKATQMDNNVFHTNEARQKNTMQLKVE